MVCFLNFMHSYRHCYEVWSGSVHFETNPKTLKEKENRNFWGGGGGHVVFEYMV